MAKEIKCVRCRKLKTVPINWQYKECQTCHERTERRTRKTTLAQIERKALETLINFEQAWKNYKKFCRQWKMTVKPKAEFQKEWFSRNQQKIDQIKAIIAKYDDSKCPIQNYECLRFRMLFSERSAHVDLEAWSNNLPTKDWNFFHNHIPKCESCNKYYCIHKDDVLPALNEFKEEGVSQAEFDKSLDAFWNTVNEPTDSLEAAIHRANPNMKPCCSICGSPLINGSCPNGH